MVVLLISPPLRFPYDRKPYVPSLTLGSLSAVLTERGIRNYILDLAGTHERDLHFAICKAFNVTRPDVVGITSLTCNSALAHAIADDVKMANPETVVVVGGVHATFEVESMLDRSSIDYVIRGEGDLSLFELISVLEGRGDALRIGGIAFRDKSSVTKWAGTRSRVAKLDFLPFPSWDTRVCLFDDSEIGCIPLAGSRGCPFSCAFCSSQAFFGPVRFRSLENLVCEIHHHLERTSPEVRKFAFVDDTFTAVPARVENFSRMLAREDLGIQWSCMARAESLDSRLTSVMRSAGCVEVFLGIESSSSKTQELVGKNLNLESVSRTVEACHEQGIRVKGSAIIGLPGDTKGDVRRTIEYMKKLKLEKVALGFLTPFPGTALWERPQDYGITIIETDLSKFDCLHPVSESNWLSVEESIELFFEGFNALCDPRSSEIVMDL